jgi:hypothetical protein
MADLADIKIEHRPSIRQGLIAHLGVLFLLLAISGYILYLALVQQSQGVFILYLITSILLFLPFPYFLYRLVSLVRAKYIISRNGVSFQWGLRTEDIPIGEIEWVRQPDDLAIKTLLPQISFPGAVLGTRKHRDLGKIEYIASNSKRLVMIATKEKIFAISPGNTNVFLNDFNLSAEMGSITPFEKQSTQPQFILSSLINDKNTRIFILAGILLSLSLLISVSFLIPTRSTVPLGLEAVGIDREESSSERLILLPLLSLFFYFINFGYGSYLFRKKGYKNASYIVFASSLILPISFFAILLMIIFS